MEQETFSGAIYPSQNVGSSFPRITLLSMPESSMAAKRIIPPDEPSLDIANATAESKKKN